MTDLEMTKLCAEAMGYTDTLTAGGKFYCVVDEPPEWAKPTTGKGGFVFDPLHDDAQAMALLKHMKLIPRYIDIEWRVDWARAFSKIPGQTAFCADLNRAIVTCVAKVRSTEAQHSAGPSDNT